MEIRRLKTEDLQVERPPYVDAIGLLGAMDTLRGKPTILFGPKGTGKTMGLEAWAADHDYVVVQFGCTEGTREKHFYGALGLEGGNVFFTLGCLTTAIDVANELAGSKEHAGVLLRLDEVNACTPQMQKGLNSFTDWQKSVAVPNIGRVFKLRKDANLWVVATMNPCFHPDTDVLTPTGIKRIMELKEGDPVYSMNIETGEREIDEVTAVWGQPCDNGLIHVEGRTVDLLVTPNHRLIWRSQGKKDYSWHLDPAEKVMERRVDLPKPFGMPFDHEGRQPNDGKSLINLAAFAPWGKSHKVNRPLILNPPTWEDFCELLGYYLADGNPYYNEKKKDYRITITRSFTRSPQLRCGMEACLERMGINFNAREKDITISDKMLYNALVYAGGRYSEHKTIHPYILSRAPHSALERLFHAAYACDGNRTGSRRYTTKSKELAYQMTWLANVVMGEATAWHSPDFDGYRIGLSEQRNGSAPQDFVPLEYTGTVINVSVKKNHTLCAGRNGKFVFVGNSGHGGLYDLNEDLKSRFRQVWVSYPKEQQERTILRTMLPNADPALVDNLVGIASETRQGALAYQLSTRDLVQCIEDAEGVNGVPGMGFDKAVKLLSYHYDEGQDRDAFHARVLGKTRLDLTTVEFLIPPPNLVPPQRAGVNRRSQLQ